MRDLTPRAVTSRETREPAPHVKQWIVRGPDGCVSLEVAGGIATTLAWHLPPVGAEGPASKACAFLGGEPCAGDGSSSLARVLWRAACATSDRDAYIWAALDDHYARWIERRDA